MISPFSESNIIEMNRVTDRKQTCGHQKGEGWGWGQKPGVSELADTDSYM